jgi:hypothetical protein
MAPGSMLLHLLLGRLAWVRQLLECLDFVSELLLDLYLLAFANVLQSGAYQVTILTGPDRGVNCAIVIGTYR